jgi:hypothetical protein
MPSSTTRTVGPAVNTIDASALESLEAINHRLKDGGITLHLSEVKGPVVDRLKRSHFPEELTGKVHLTQNWTSFGGSGNQNVNQMNLQPFAAYFLPDGWSIGYSGNVLANWKADSAGDVWTIPLGLSVSKVVKLGKLPVRFALAGQYMVHHPDTFGQKWNIQFMMVPVIPKLIKGDLLGE